MGVSIKVESYKTESSIKTEFTSCILKVLINIYYYLNKFDYHKLFVERTFMRVFRIFTILSVVQVGTNILKRYKTILQR